MGLPEISIMFKGLAAKAIQRSKRGVVSIIIRDTKAKSMILNGVEEVPAPVAMEAKNIKFINQIFDGGCRKVIVEVVAPEELSGYKLQDTLTRLKVQVWNYLVYPEADNTEIASIVTFIKNERDQRDKSFKAVVSSPVAPDHEGIIDFHADNLKIVGQEESPTAQEYTPRIAGILAALPFTRSSTYYVLPEVESVDLVLDPNAEINKGKLILINDGEKIKIASGVNSLTTIVAPKTNAVKDIFIVEKMDFVKDDIKKVYHDEYIGKVVNNYNNKQLFVTNINTYFKLLIRDYQFFDESDSNSVQVSALGNKYYLDQEGIDTSKMSEDELKRANTGKKVFLEGSVKFTNTMSDLELILNM